MAKKKIDLKYRLEIIWSQEDECYVVRFPELPGCTTHGNSINEAIRHAHEAVEGYLDSLKARGLPLPKPLSEKKFSGKIPLRIDPNLHRDLAFQAEIEGVSVNRFIEKKLKKAV